MKIPFGSQSAKTKSREGSTERLLNCRLKANPKNSKSPIEVSGRPGLDLWASIGTGPLRGATKFQDVLHVLSGTQLYSVDSAGAGTALGSIFGGNRVMMSAGFDELVIVDEPNGYVWNGSLTPITDPGFAGAASVAYIGGFHIFGKPNSDEFFISANFDALNYDALDFAAAESKNDKLIRPFEDHGELWLFGAESVEIWANSGAEFPFQPVGSAVIEQGLAAKYAVTKMDNTLYWLANDRTIRMARGYGAPERVSTDEVDAALAKYTGIAFCDAFTYKAEGHETAVFRFPDEATWCFDAATRLWHESASFRLKDWRLRDAVSIYDKTLFCDPASNKIYALNPDRHDDAGQVLERMAVSPIISAFPGSYVADRLEIDMDGGLGLTVGQGSNPKIMVDWSDDAGATWSPERQVSIGKIGEYKNKAVVNRLGEFRDRSFRIRMTDPTPFRIFQADLQGEGIPV